MNLFATPIYKKKLNLNLKELEDYCYHNQKTCFGRSISNHKGWQSLPIKRDLTLNSFYIELLNTLNDYKEMVGAKGHIILNDVWININSKGSSNIAHIHTDCFMSGVFYVKTPKYCGDLYFENLNAVNYNWNKKHFIDDVSNLYCNDTWSIVPEENTIIVFPSWAKHGVLTNASNNDRISISFNASIDK